MRRILTIVFSLGVGLALTTPARAADFTWTFTGSGAQTGLAASAVFHDMGGGVLQITLTNTGNAAVDTNPGNTLSGLLFDCAGCGTLSPAGGSAITSGPITLNGVQTNPTGTNVGGEWGFGSQTDVNPHGYVFTATGAFNSLGSLNSGPGNLGGGDLDGQNALDGIDYGIVPAGTNTTGFPGSNHLIDHDVIFTLTGFTGALNPTNVSFQYGTSTTEFNSNSGSGTGSGGGSGQTLTPEPTSLLLFGTGLAMTAYRARRKTKQQKDV